jgi:hypothetical protein
MTGEHTVVASPLFGSFLELARQGFEFALWPDGTVQVRPIERLPADTRALMQRHPDDLRLLVSILADDEVQRRRSAFDAQLAVTPAPRLPPFLLQHGLPYVPGRCFSCDEALLTRSYGRCWRCSLAWRLACRLPLTEPVAEALDAAKVIA